MSTSLRIRPVLLGPGGPFFRRLGGDFHAGSASGLTPSPDRSRHLFRATRPVAACSGTRDIVRRVEEVRIPIRVKPGSSRIRVGGRHGEKALIVAVSAKAVDGAATEADRKSTRLN